MTKIYSSNSCVLEIDLEYPKELHFLHNEYPLPPDKIEIKKPTIEFRSKKINKWINKSIKIVMKMENLCRTKKIIQHRFDCSR